MTTDVRPGDCLDVLRAMPDESVDAVVCDPPYGLSNLRPDAITAALVAWANGDRERVPDARGFMGRAWDAFVPPPAVWDECLRVLKPGGHLVAFAGARTYDLMGLSVRLAGFEIRDGLQWLYGSGMPKSLNVGKAITATEKHGGANSVRIRKARLGDDYTTTGRAGNRDGVGGPDANRLGDDPTRYVETELTENGERWSGFGTALKPAHEPMVLARKPFRGTVARNVLAHGTGGLNIDATRVGGEGGRWPANVILDEHAAAVLDEQAPSAGGGFGVRGSGGQSVIYDHGRGFAQSLKETGQTVGYGDSGGASRFFYCAKAPTSERPKVDGQGWPTVKPLSLMRWVVRLITPPGGTVLDPFAGTGTTLQAAEQEGMHAIGIERDELALRLIAARLSASVGAA